MKVYAIFANKKKILAVNGLDLGIFRPSIGMVFLFAVKSQRIGSRILKRIIEKILVKE